jgi:membrane protease YdiL (CAAX protease family)
VKPAADEQPVSAVRRGARRRAAGPAFFVATTFASSWAASALVADLNLPTGPSHALPAAAAMYFVTMGWQPLAASWLARRWFDPLAETAVAPAHRRYFALAIAAPFFAMVAAGVIAVATGAARSAPLGPIALGRPDALAALSVTLGFGATLLAVWAQAFAEELAWRGYFLSRLVRALGPWRALVLHGAIWGLWYAPPLLILGARSTPALGSAGFVVTCVLIGALLGWLRLASRSILPSATANAVLTLGAGLPLLLRGVDVGARGAAFEPVGWGPWVVLVAVAATFGRFALAPPRGHS